MSNDWPSVYRHRDNIELFGCIRMGTTQANYHTRTKHCYATTIVVGIANCPVTTYDSHGGLIENQDCVALAINSDVHHILLTYNQCCELIMRLEQRMKLISQNSPASEEKPRWMIDEERNT